MILRNYLSFWSQPVVLWHSTTWQKWRPVHKGSGKAWDPDITHDVPSPVRHHHLQQHQVSNTQAFEDSHLGHTASRYESGEHTIIC